MAKNILEVQASNLSIEFISTIISNIYGPGESSDRLIKSIIKKALKNERVSLTSCEQLYDFIYITDAIRAFYLIGENGTSFQEYYIGNKNIKKMKEYIYEISQVFNGNIELGIGDIDFTGVDYDPTDVAGAFSGTIDGDNHLIINLNVTSEIATLINEVDGGTIKNLGINNCTFENTSGSYAGSIAATAIGATIHINFLLKILFILSKFINSFLLIYVIPLRNTPLKLFLSHKVYLLIQHLHT